MKTLITTVVLGVVLGLGSGSIAQENAAQPKADRPSIYDANADGAVQVKTALVKADKENTRVLIQWGADWCGWCHLLNGTMNTDREVRRTLQYEYEVVHIDIGRFDKHMNMAKVYGANLRESGVPFLTILDGDGKVIANQETGSLEAEVDGKAGHDAGKVNAFLVKHKATPLNAESELEHALAAARQQDKLVFLHFGAPWCGWCHKLEAWMARPEVDALLKKDFVDLKIDTDRMVGGQELYEQFAKGQHGIPFFAFLDGEGRVVADSMGPDGNLGCPYTEEEVEAFGQIMRRVTKRIDGKGIQMLMETLAEGRK